MKVDLFAAQPYMEAQDYFSPQAFARKIERYFKACQTNRQPGLPACLVFPEDLATFLLLLGESDILKELRSMDQAFVAIGKRRVAALLGTMLRYGTPRIRRAFFLEGASRVWRIWYSTMTQFARQYNMTVVAGSALLPAAQRTYDTADFRPKNARVYNLSFTAGPNGQILYTTRKVNLVPTQEDELDLTAGTLRESCVMAELPGTRVPMATAICYDGFWRPHTQNEPRFVNVLRQLDRLGARLVAQPSANPWRWNEAWPFDSPPQQRRRSQQWDEEGAPTALAECNAIEVIINPQLQLEFLDLHFDGQSRIFGRKGSQVHTLASSQEVTGANADAVIHAQWDFAIVDGESKI